MHVDHIRVILDSAHSFLPSFDGFHNNPEGAIRKLMQEKQGEVPDAYIHSEIGKIGFVYGDVDMGLAHIAAKRGAAFIDRIPDVLRHGRVVKDKGGLKRVYLVSDDAKPQVVVIRLDWDGVDKTWLVTSYTDNKGKFAENKGSSDILDSSAATNADGAADKFCVTATTQQTSGTILGAPAEIVKMPIFDSVADDLARLRLAGEASKLLVERNTLTGDDTATVLRKLQNSRRLREIALLMGLRPPTADGAIAGDVSSDPDDELSDDPNSPNYRYRDTGYIADSRKELAASTIATARKSGQRVRATDVDWEAIELNPREATDLVTKANLFGKTDWQRLQAAGMDPAAGFLIDKVYASIATGPSTDNPQARRDYAFGLETIRDRLENKVTAAEVVDVLAEIRQELTGATLNSDEAERFTAIAGETDAVNRELRDIRARLTALYEAAQIGKTEARRAAELIAARRKRGYSVDNKLLDEATRTQNAADALWAAWTAPLTESRGTIDALEASRRALYLERDDITTVARTRAVLSNPVTRAWMTFGDRFHKLLHFRSLRGGSDTFAGHVTNAKAGRITDWSWSDKERPTAPRDATKQEINFQMRVAENYERKGGRAITVESTIALKDSLGFREVQSGNWVLKDPNSAKFHVEQTAAAMSDLSDILGVDMGLIGFGGRLGMAFGARGTGGKNAARAHYEPVHRVINLTKMGGGGSLGHEYFHALDNVVHELVNEKTSATKNDFVTANPELLPAGGLRDAVANLRTALLSGDHRSMATFKFTDADISTAKRNIDMPRHALSKAIKEAGGATAAVLAVRTFYPASDNKAITKRRNDWSKLAVAYYAQPGELTATLPVGPPVSSFALEAAKLDNHQMGKYWSQPEEMAARAFQSWLEDRLAAQERQNDYLSAFADNKHHFDPILGVQYNPFPEGAERERLNAAFDRLFEEVRTHQVFEKSAANKQLLDAVFSPASEQEIQPGEEVVCLEP